VSAASLRPDTPEKLFAHRWVRLSTFKLSVPWTLRTLERWAKSGRLPASRRFGAREWWVDVQAVRRLRRDGSDEMFDEDEIAA
jgi:hypothetical protein